MQKDQDQFQILGLLKDAMDGWVAASTLVLAWGLLHLRLTTSDLGDLRRWIESLMAAPRQQVDVLKDVRVEEEMIKIRQSNYKFITRCFSHITFLAGIGLVLHAALACRLDSVAFAGCSVVAYAQHVIVSKNLVNLTPERLKFLTWLMHTMQIVLIMASGASETGFQFAVWQGFHWVTRFALIVAFLDPGFSIPFQFIFTLAEMSVYFVVFEPSSVHLGSLFISQFFMIAINIASSVYIDLLLRRRIYALLDTADAESLVSSFRQMLRGVCDGEVLLDSHMNVAQESDCLKHLILTSVSLKGRSFERLLVPDEVPRFSEFIKSSTESCCAPESKHSSTPGCLRVSFRGSAGIRVAADIYHVPISGLFGAREPYHLIAFKEDLECRPQPDAAEDSLPAELLLTGQSHAADFLQKDNTSVISASTGRSSCAHGCPELQEMTLLVDADTLLQDVQEAHLKFRRCEAPDDLGAGLQSSMPSLRKLVKPTDWEKIRSTVATFVERALQDPTVQSRVIKRMSLQLPGHFGRVIAEEATLKRYPRDRKVWLHMKGFRPEKSRRAEPFMDGIWEGGISYRAGFGRSVSH